MKEKRYFCDFIFGEANEENSTLAERIFYPIMILIGVLAFVILLITHFYFVVIHGTIISRIVVSTIFSLFYTFIVLLGILMIFGIAGLISLVHKNIDKKD